MTDMIETARALRMKARDVSHGDFVYSDAGIEQVICTALTTVQAGAIAAFTAKILHGDEDHRAWLHEACEAFIAGEDMPAPRGKGRTEAQRDGAIAEAVGLRRALQECQRVLADLTNPEGGFGGVDILTVWARSVEAETHARAALSASPRAAAVMGAIEALKPFDDMAGELFARNWERGQVVLALDNPDDPHRLLYDDFLRVRDALARLDGET